MMRVFPMAVLAGLIAAGAELRAEGEEKGNDDKVAMEALNEAIEGLNEKVKVLSAVSLEGFVDLRYDDERRPSSNAGQSGVYARRAEFKFHGKLKNLPHVKYALGFDFTELKHKDLGIEVGELGLLPFVDLPEWHWTLKLGQYRQPFGIVPQTSSSSILFSERPIIFGGKHLAGGAKLVGERVMGFQGAHAKKLGFVNYVAQFGGFNNAEEDQASGKNKIGATDAFPKQLGDQDFSWIGRFAIEWAFLYGILPEKSKIQTGGSYIRDSQNTTWMAQLDAAIKFDEIYGAELLVELANKTIVLQSEFVKAQNDLKYGAGITNFMDGWYGDLALDLLPLFASEIEKGDRLDIMFRIEDMNTYAPLTGAHASKASRAGAGLKWSYGGGKSHTALNYFVDAPDQQFGIDARTSDTKAPSTMLVIQQQYAFE